MGKWKGRNGTPTTVLEAFVLRARRVVSHPLMREHRELMQSLYAGK
ncbi:hypothetical protein [Nocardia callitridis]|uniref:Transposase n=1 Tax=Nocardia callitridis TaxID=648753 RepID=A0ABP9KWR8_9NOCA